MTYKIIIRKTLIQLLIFSVYLVFTSLALFNDKGGADIAFTFLLGVFILFHLIAIITYTAKDFIKKQGKSYYIDFLSFIGIILIFFLFGDEYLDLMWWLSHLGK